MQIGALGQKLRDEIGAIVHGDLRLMIERGVDVRVVGGVVLALDRVSRDVVILHERGGHFVLRRKRIRGAENHVRAAVTQSDGEVGRFAGDVQARRHANALQRLILDELLADQLQNGHVLIGPFDPALALFGKRDIFYVAC